MNLSLFMKDGISRILNTAGRFYLSNQAGRAFLAGIVPKMKAGFQLREQYEKEGIHIPPFLIASIASQCNLRCSGCYAREGGACQQPGQTPDLAKEEWADLFQQAASIGISFILLAGGEPFTRRDVLQAAAGSSDIVFPVFTNGTMLNRGDISLLDSHRNLIPILSVEGGREATDERRGTGTYDKVELVMKQLKAKGILFGVSVTVTKENMDAVLQPAFLAELRGKGCGGAIFVEYVPAEKGTEHLVLNQSDCARLKQRTALLKKRFTDIVIVSFPGDEEAMGGCLASGRGFFHINPKGGAEPCPFSPYPKENLKSSSLLQVIQSQYFLDLQSIAANAPHMGGCVLFGCREEVEALRSR